MHEYVDSMHISICCSITAWDYTSTAFSIVIVLVEWHVLIMICFGIIIFGIVMSDFLYIKSRVLVSLILWQVHEVVVIRPC